MWLKNFINYIFARMIISWGNDNAQYAFEGYKSTNEVVTAQVTGDHTIGATGNRTNRLDAIISLPTGAFNYSQNVNYDPANIVFGSGTTPVTADDYKLDAIITSGLSFSTSAVIDTANKKVGAIVTVTASDDRTINEVGYAFDNVLFFRQVLDAPVVLATGDSATFRLDFSLSGATVAVV